MEFGCMVDREITTDSSFIGLILHCAPYTLQPYSTVDGRVHLSSQGFLFGTKPLDCD